VPFELSVTDTIMEKSFWVGVYPGMTEEMIEYMAKMLKNGVK
jgi:CDP-6-deoxy-D-xylo-4-hexulose-3-dehydrase